MKIKLDFGEEEIRTLLRDIGPVWAAKGLREFMRDPVLRELLITGMRMGMDSGAEMNRRTRRRRRRRGPPPPPDGFDQVVDAEFEGPFGSPPPYSSPLDDVRRRPPPGDLNLPNCMPTPSNTYQEAGWVCCQCSVYNGDHRDRCRQCEHERCGPKPAGGPDVPSGSA